jgi:predicted GNAT family acetyltransferase
MASSPCSHLSSIQILEAPDEVDGCETCLAEGGHWLHLRMCMTCGEVGCCDDSVGQHARKHAEKESHPVVRSIELEESWSYCFVDDVIFQIAGVEPRVQEAPHRLVHNEDVASVDLWVGRDVVSSVKYEKVGDAINVVQTSVADGKDGLGYDGEVLREAIRIFANQGKSVIPSDEFARAYIKYRPELHDMIPGSMRARMFGESDD